MAGRNRNRNKLQMQKRGLIKPVKMYTESQLMAATNKVRTSGFQHMDAIKATDDLNLLLQRVDLLAVHANISDLPKLLDKHDEMLSAMHTRLIGTYRLIDFMPMDMPKVQRMVTGRMEGIQRLPQDGGDHLRKMIVERPAATLGDLAQRINKKRQGEGIMPRNWRLYEMVKEDYNDYPNWQARALGLKQALQEKIEDQEADDTDRELFTELCEKYKTGYVIALRDFVATTYNNVKNSKALKHMENKSG